MPLSPGCPNSEDLQHFLLGQLAAAEVERLAAHVARCGHCVALLGAFQMEDELLKTVTAAAPRVGQPLDALLENLIERTSSLRSPSSPSATAPMGGLLAEVARPAEEATAEVYDFLEPPQEAGEIGRLGSYRVVKVLGVGGMGIVFQAFDPQLQRWVALKTMKPVLAASPSARRRFLREAQAIAGIEHSQIVTILHVGGPCSVPRHAIVTG